MDLQRILDHYRHPHNVGALADATHRAEQVNPTCGDAIAMDVRVVDDRIEAARYDVQGCAITTAAASLLSDAMQGQRPADVAQWGLPHMLELLGTDVAPARIPCAVLPLHVAQHALVGRSQVERELHRRGTTP